MTEDTQKDIVVSSRIRLARNIKGLAFSNKLAPEKAREVPAKVYSSLPASEAFSLIKISELSPVGGAVLKERHLVSDDLLSNRLSGAALISSDETVSIMVNEEDHVREQCIVPGFSLAKAYRKIVDIDSLIQKKLPFSFDERLGYLTACPTNLGTGMRASAMMFLPGLSVFGKLNAVVGAVQRLNMTVRGVYGEGSDSLGYMYQVSNQISLGLSESEILDAVEASVAHIIDAEKQARAMLLKTQETELKDRIFRAYGILSNAYTIGSEEFMELMAFLKLGAYYGLITVTDSDRFDRLITSVQPGSLVQAAGEPLDADERDKRRADYVSKTILETTRRT